MSQLAKLGIIQDVSGKATSMQEDLTCLMSQAKIARERWGRQEIELETLSFWFKSTIHAFFAQAEGLCAVLGQAVRENGDSLGVELSNKQLSHLSETRRQPLETRIKTSFRSFAKLFGANFTLDTGSEAFRAFKALAAARDAFTHPKVPRDLRPFALLATFNAGVEWFLLSWGELLLSCASVSGVPLRSSAMAGGSKYSDSRLQTFLERQEEYEAGTKDDGFLAELREIVFGLMQDTTEALTLVKTDSEAKIPPATAFRNLVRTLFSEIEGSTFVAWSYLCRYGFRESGPSEELLVGAHEDVRERLIKTLEDFSYHFGFRKSVSREGPNWKAFSAARSLRNRLTHPRSPEDLLLGEVDLNATLATFDWWHGEVHSCFELSDKIADAEGQRSMKEIVEG